MYCKECGCKIADEAKFCSNCGTKQNVEQLKPITVQPKELVSNNRTTPAPHNCPRCNCVLIPTHNTEGVELFICPNCNSDIKTGKCPVCHKPIPSFRSTSCKYCGFRWKDEIVVAPPVKTERYSTPFEPIKSYSEPKEAALRCPNCSSTNILANKKGYSAGKAVTGVVLTGGIGLLGGFFGSSKIKITCLKCGHSWNAGK